MLKVWLFCHRLALQMSWGLGVAKSLHLGKENADDDLDYFVNRVASAIITEKEKGHVPHEHC